MSCDAQLDFVCKRPDIPTAVLPHVDGAIDAADVEPAAAITTPIPGACEAGWLQFEDQCYTEPAFGVSEYRTWSNAQADCQQVGAHLAVIHSQALQCKYERSEDQWRRKW